MSRKPMTEQSPDQPNARTSFVAWRAVVTPTEHGGWGFVLEPILLGLLVAPSSAAFLLALSTLFAFLGRQPLKIGLIDRRRRLNTERTRRANFAAVILGVLAAATVAGALWLAGPRMLVPLAMAAPFAAVYLYFDLTKPGRTLQAELAGPLATSFVASGMAVIAGWPLLNALALWAALSLRAVPAVLYVRARIRLDRGRQPNTAWPVIAHGLALITAGVLVWAILLPIVSLVVYTLLLARAAWFLSARRPMVKVKTIGFMELGLGLFLVFALAAGFAFQ